MKSVLLVEDEPRMRERISAAISGAAAYELAAACGTVAEALAFVDPVDILLADLGLPDGSGADVIRAFRARSPDTVSMVLSAFADEKSVIKAIEAGACGYILKDGTDPEIVSALDELVAGGSPITPRIARHLLMRLQPAVPPAEAPSLSAREKEVLELLAKGFKYGEIAELLGIGASTVTTHVRRLYRKLEVTSRGEAVYEATSMGILSG